MTTYGWGNHGIRTENWRYIRYQDGSEELYDHRKDPNEWNNLIPDGDYNDEVIRLREFLPEVNRPYTLHSSYDYNPYFSKDKLLYSE